MKTLVPVFTEASKLFLQHVKMVKNSSIFAVLAASANMRLFREKTVKELLEQVS